MTLEDLGYNKALEEFRLKNDLNGFEVGRIIAEHSITKWSLLKNTIPKEALKT